MLIYQADATDLILDPKFDVLITSPPYNVGIEYANSDDNHDKYNNFSSLWLLEAYDNGSSNARLCVNIPIDTNKNGYIPFAYDFVRVAQKTGWKYRSTIVWNKGNYSTAFGSFGRATAPNVMAPVELIVVFYKGEWNRRKENKTSTITNEQFLEYQRGFWTFPGEKRSLHPAPFPVELPKRLIQLYSFKEDIIHDPFCGSGTTGLAAKNEGRKFICTDISEKYIKVASERIYG